MGIHLVDSVCLRPENQCRGKGFDLHCLEFGRLIMTVISPEYFRELAKYQPILAISIREVSIVRI